MSLPLSREVGAVLTRAQELADGEDQPVSTAHMLIAICEVPSQAEKLLRDRFITTEALKRARRGQRSEDGRAAVKVKERSERLAQGARAEAVTSLHLLAGLVRETRSQAYKLLEECGADIGAIRAAVMSYATASRPVPQRYRTLDSLEVGPVRARGGVERTPGFEQEAPTPIGFHPSLEVGRRRVAEPINEPVEVEERPKKESPRPASSTPKKGRGAIDSLRETGGGLALDNHPGINRGGKPRYARRIKPQEAKENKKPSPENMDARRRAEAIEEAQKTTQELAERLFARINTPKGAEAPEEVNDVLLPEGPVRRSATIKPDPLLAARYALEEEDYPFLTKYGRNLTEEAALGRIDSVVGRDSEVAQLIDILGKRRANNPLLVGEAGVGKTAIVEGLACRLVEMARQQKPFGERKIIELEMGRLLSGTHLRGAFSERLLGIKDEVARAEGDVIVFLDEIHTWMGAGAGGDGGDAAGELKTALARGSFPCIGATTFDEFRKFVESDPAFERRFQRVIVEEPDQETALEILEGVRAHYENHHGVSYSPEALSTAVSLAVRYIHERQLPDKAIGIIDLAGSRAARQGQDLVDREAIARVVAEMAQIPAERLTGSDGERFLYLEELLAEEIVGHGEIVGTIAELLRRNYAGFRSQRPIGSLLFLGPTGVGKTEMVKALANVLFHDRDAIVRLDMSEFMEAHSVSRFIGAPPGYVGYEQGGQLTEAIRRRPYQVVLLDEVEKAHPDVLNLLLQLFDEGRLTDGQGRVVDFSNALIVMTSNLGAETFAEEKSHQSGRIGFADFPSRARRKAAAEEARREQVLDAARQYFTPELWNRIDERLVFLPLSREEVAAIARLQLADSQRRLFEEGGIVMDYDEAIIEYLIAQGGYDEKLGARPMRQTIQRLVESAVARAILTGAVGDGGKLYVAMQGDELVVEIG